MNSFEERWGARANTNPLIIEAQRVYNAGAVPSQPTTGANPFAEQQTAAAGRMSVYDAQKQAALAEQIRSQAQIQEQSQNNLDKWWELKQLQPPNTGY